MRTAAAIGLAGVTLITVALSFESSILFVPGIALVLVSLAVPARVAGAARGASLARTLHSDRVLEDQPLEATIELVHGRLGLPGAHVIEPLVGGVLALRVSVSSIRPARVELRVVARFERRGRRTLAAPRLTLADPLGLVKFEREGEGAGQEVLVLPRLELPRRLGEHPARRPRFDGGSSSPDTPAAFEVDGLQPYRYGTPASRIHWASLARGAGLLERRIRAEAGAGPLVVLDARCVSTGEPLDRAVRAAASLTHFLARRAGCELLLPGERRTVKVEPDLGAWSGAHARLAVVEGGPGAPAPAVMPRQGIIYYVAAAPAAEWLRSGPGPLENAVLVLPAELAAGIGRPATLEVAGCLGFPLAAIRRPPPPLERSAA